MQGTIAIDVTSALSQGGGIGRFTLGLIQGLAAVPSPYRYQLAYTKDKARAALALPDRFGWRRLPLTEKQAIWLWHRLRLPLPADWLLGRPALFHAPDYTLPPLGRARGIVTVHDLSYEALPEVHLPKLRRYLQRAVPRSIERADHLFADSESTRAAIMEHYGTPADKITVVYPGVEARFRPFDPTSEEDAMAQASVRRAYGLEEPFLLSIGTLEPRKNLGTLLEAFARFRAAQPASPVTLAIAGGGGWLNERDQLHALVPRLGLGDAVRFLGFVPDEQLPALINLAAALAYPSLYEGFGLPVLEALACGVPVITARNSSLPEAGGEAARYIEEARDPDALAAAIREVLADGALRARMVAKGLAHASRFSWEATARQVVGLYGRVLAQSEGEA